MKRIIALLLAFCLLIALAACGSSDSGSSKAPKPTVKPQGPTTLLGDADGDGELTILDATRIQRHLAGLKPLILDENIKYAIVSGEDKLTILDATYIQRYLARVIKKLPAEEKEENQQTSDADTLVVYFSCTGHTEPLAEYAAAYLDADIFEIEASVRYTDKDIDYNTDCRSKQESKDPDVRPVIKGTVRNMKQYKTIVLAYPIWYDQAPKIIYTFLESYDFAGKTIIPFCTSSSSDIASSLTDLHQLAPDAKWVDGKRFEIGTKEAAIQQWLDEALPEPEQPTVSATTAPTESVKDDASDAELYLMIGDMDVAVEWEDNESVAALKEALIDSPLMIDMKMYEDFEQIGSLDMVLPHDDSELTAEAGDVFLFDGDSFVIFYGSNSWQYTRLGRIMDLSEDDLYDLLAYGEVTITLYVD